MFRIPGITDRRCSADVPRIRELHRADGLEDLIAQSLDLCRFGIGRKRGIRSRLFSTQIVPLLAACASEWSGWREQIIRQEATSMSAIGLLDAASVLEDQASGRVPDRVRVLSGALASDALCAEGVTDRDILDAAARLQLLATGRA